jgi:hypothetical protein
MMFYGNYNPYFNGATPDTLNMYKQPYQAPQMPVKTASELLWVLNENEAVSFPVAMNSTVTLWDKNNPTIYVKSVDAQGVPSIRILDFVERTATTPSPQASVEYVKQDEFKALQEQFAELTSKFEAISGKETKN